jgi:excisionase family DNA binding protein
MRVGKANGREWLRLAEAAEALGVSHNTLRHWCDDGHLRCFRSPGGHRRFRRADVEAALRASGRGGGQDVAAGAGPAETSWQDSALQALAGVAMMGTSATSCFIAVEDGEEALRVVAVHGDGDPPALGSTATFASRPAEAEVVRGRRRLLIPDVARTRLLARAAADDYCRKGYLALLIVPLSLQDGRLGTLCLGDSRGPHSFDMAAMTFAESMAHHAAILLSNGGRDSAGGLDGMPAAPAGMLPAGTAERSRTEIGPVGVARLGDRPSPAHTAVDALGGRPDVTWCRVSFVEAGRARVLASAPAGPTDTWDLDDLPPAAGVLLSGEPHLLGRDDARLSESSRARFFDDRAITGLVLAPVLRQGQIIGIVEAGGVDLGALWTAIPAVAAVAALLAGSLAEDEVLSELRRREQDLAALREVWLQDTARMSATDVLRDIVERVALATLAPIVEIYAVEGETATALVSYDSGRWDRAWEDVALRLARYPTSRRAVETGQPVTVLSLDDGSLQPDDRYSLERWGYQSHLALPLKSGELVLGLLELYDYVPRDFADDLDLVSSLARVAARTLGDERLAEQARRRNAMISELVTIAGVCASGVDERSLAASVTERLQAVVDAGSCQVFRICPRGVLCLAGHDRSGRDEAAAGTITDMSRYPTAVKAMNAHETLIVASLEDGHLTPGEVETYRTLGWASEICVPLVFGDVLCGFIDIADTRVRGYAEQADFLQSVARLLAVSLENGRLQQDLSRRDADLEAIASLAEAAVGAPGDPAVLEGFATRVRQKLEAADCDVFAHDEGHLRCLVSVDERGRDESAPGTPFDVDRFPATAQAVRTGEVVVVPDLDDPRLTHHERLLLGEWGYRSEVCVPLLSKGRVSGVIDVFDTRPRDYAEHRAYLAALAPLAASIVDAALAREGSSATVTTGPRREE